MNRLTAIFILLLHINYSMFIPQVDEQDTYDKKGNRLEDVNSLVDFVDAFVLHHKRVNQPDEDDDGARYFHIVKIDVFSNQFQIVTEHRPVFEVPPSTNYQPYLLNWLPQPVCDIHSPPPEA